MFELTETIRKTRVLKHPTLRCLGPYYTINLLAGCPYECRYCYTQSYGSHPGWGKVVFYSNTLESLKRELPRMRKRPGMVYFSTVCEPFTSHPRVLETLFGVMTLLLEHSVPLLISTKSLIPVEFIELLAKFREQVFVQAGLTTTNDRIRQVIEPQAPAVVDRLANISQLCENKIPFEVRADPLIPELTDTQENVRKLFEAIAARGAKRVVTSHVFLRPGNMGPLSKVRLDGFSFTEMAGRLFTRKIENYCGSYTIQVADRGYRQEKYREIEEAGKVCGVEVGFCRCKNPDVKDQCCHPAGVLSKSSGPEGGQMAFSF